MARILLHLPVNLDVVFSCSVDRTQASLRREQYLGELMDQMRPKVLRDLKRHLKEAKAKHKRALKRVRIVRVVKAEKLGVGERELVAKTKA